MDNLILSHIFRFPKAVSAVGNIKNSNNNNSNRCNKNNVKTPLTDNTMPRKKKFKFNTMCMTF